MSHVLMKKIVLDRDAKFTTMYRPQTYGKKESEDVCNA